jgi:hypothetical protein
MNVKRTFRRAAFLLSRLLGNHPREAWVPGVGGSTPVLARFRSPVDAARGEKRWLEGLYLDTPEEWDDLYRFFRWRGSSAMKSFTAALCGNNARPPGSPTRHEPPD